MADDQSSNQPPNTPDHGATIQQLMKLQAVMTDDNSPLVAELRTYMGPYEAAHAAGQIDDATYKQIGGQFAQKWVADKMFGGKLPTQADFDGPLREHEYGTRVDALTADPRNAQMVAGKTREQLLAELEQRTPQPLGPQLKAMQALWSLTPSQPVQEAPRSPERTPASTQRAPDRPRQPRRPTRRQKLPNPTADQKLAESQLLLLEQLHGAGAPSDDEGPGLPPSAYDGWYSK